MAPSRLLPCLLLAVLLLLAAAPAGHAAPVHGCQPEVLAPTVALFCARGQPAQWCCQALAHSASVGGGARCLCRLAAEDPLVRARLGGTDLLRLYAACRGGRAASTCADHGGAAEPPVDRSGCAAAVLADQMELFCGRRGSSSSSGPPNPPCCEAVVGSARKGADGVPCFCHVPVLSSGFDVDRISSLYAACVAASDPGAVPHLAVYMCPSSDGV
ncbi:unnamed protein product [Urochloa decumbens]|uniref:Bifunctional inhibitor/plant lipid transfer protein/seed storage helical domain-containing protein n=1 Tax=Urochloa decumbens TaxID=240449 RepID=A0ABC8XIK1_9POAL